MKRITFGGPNLIAPQHTWAIIKGEQRTVRPGESFPAADVEDAEAYISRGQATDGNAPKTGGAVAADKE